MAPALRFAASVTLLAAFTTPDQSVTADDFAVYAVVLDSLHGPPLWRRATRILVSDSTDRYLRSEFVPGVIESFLRIPGVDSAMVRSFEARNRIARPLEGLRAGAELEVTLIRAGDLDSLPRTPTDPESFWKAMRARYPGAQAAVSVSSVGYNADRTLAILKIRHGCGSLCGGGDDVLLRRVGDGWEISAVAMRYVH